MLGGCCKKCGYGHGETTFSKKKRIQWATRLVLAKVGGVSKVEGKSLISSRFPVMAMNEGEGLGGFHGRKEIVDSGALEPVNRYGPIGSGGQVAELNLEVGLMGVSLLASSRVEVSSRISGTDVGQRKHAGQEGLLKEG